jgi:hypothetical protein
MDIENVINCIDFLLVSAMGIVTGASIALKYIAPRTKNTVDDKIYLWLIKILEWLSFANKTVKKS